MLAARLSQGSCSPRYDVPVGNLIFHGTSPRQLAGRACRGMRSSGELSISKRASRVGPCTGLAACLISARRCSASAPLLLHTDLERYVHRAHRLKAHFTLIIAAQRKSLDSLHAASTALSTCKLCQVLFSQSCSARPPTSAANPARLSNPGCWGT